MTINPVAAVMHLTAVHDIAATTTSNGTDDSDLHGDDKHALHQTVAQLTGKRKRPSTYE
jgi:hypothetical protein